MQVIVATQEVRLACLGRRLRRCGPSDPVGQCFYRSDVLEALQNQIPS
jgi:hypothetical protein